MPRSTDAQTSCRRYYVLVLDESGPPSIMLSPFLLVFSRKPFPCSPHHRPAFKLVPISLGFFIFPLVGPVSVREPCMYYFQQGCLALGMDEGVKGVILPSHA